MRRHAQKELNGSRIQPSVIRKHAVGYTFEQALVLSGHTPHCAAVNNSDELTTRFVIFASHVIRDGEEPTASKEEKDFHSIESCLARSQDAAYSTNTLDLEVSQHLAGCDAAYLERVREGRKGGESVSE